MQKIGLTVRGLEKEIFSGEVTNVELPGSMGRFQVLAGHAPLVGTLVKGIVRYTQEGERSELAIRGGVVEVLDNKVKVLIGGFTNVLGEERVR